MSLWSLPTVLEGLNPFAPLSKFRLAQVWQQRQARRAAEQRLQALTAAYRTLLTDTRYTPLRHEAQQLLGSALTALVERGLTCSHCATQAVTVQSLHALLLTPLATVWAEEHRPQEPVEEDDGGFGR